MNYDIPFVPSSRERLSVMTDLANIQKGQKAADLGSGDGRIVIAMAKMGAEAHGFEVDPEKVKLAKKSVQKAGLDNKAFIHQSSFWDEDLNSFDIITVYGITSIMSRLEKKLKKEIKPGCKVISNFFTFPNWQYWVRKGEIYVYCLSAAA